MSYKKIKRREFIRKGTLGLLSTGLAVPGLKNLHAGDNQQQEYKIIYRTLGKTNLKIPLISFGVMNTDKEAMLHKALEMGVKHLDTAHAYLRGNSERVIGKVLEETGSRAKVYVATKMRFARDRKRTVFLPEGTAALLGATEKDFNEQLHESLKRLRTDYIDILYIHSCSSPEMATHEILMEALQKAKKSGKVRFIGITTHENEPGVIRAAVDTGIYDVIEVAYNYLKKNRRQVKDAIQYAAKKGLGIIGMKTFGGNRLQQDSSVKINHEAALKWVLADENITTTIPGMTAFEQMEQNFRVMNNLELTPAEKRELEITSMVKGTLYCQNCRTCIASCPNSVEIPDLMRAYMYAAGYENLIQAETTVGELPADQGLKVCRSCSSCTARCANGITINHRINHLIAQGFA